jgi:hypothetical protein
MAALSEVEYAFASASHFRAAEPTAALNDAKDRLAVRKNFPNVPVAGAGTKCLSVRA